MSTDTNPKASEALLPPNAQDGPLEPVVSPVELSPQEAAKAADEALAARIGALVKTVSANPALVEFPADPWGFTTDVRKAVLKAASSVKGQRDKNLILLGTLMVLSAHIKARFKTDAEAFDKLKYDTQTALVEAEQYTRVHGAVYNPEDKVREAMQVIDAARLSGQFKDIVGH